MLVEAFYEKMLEKAVKEGKTSITYVSGAAGSGKSTSVKNNKDINLTNEGIVFDSAFNRYEGLAKKIEKAKKAGMKNISVIAVYNDAITTFKNSIEGGKKIGRFLSLQYFLDRSFGMSKNKLDLLNTNYPDVNIIPLDNSNNQGGKRVSVDEALNWDYRVNEELLYNILTILENEYINNKLNEQQISSNSRGILQISSLTTPRVQQLARNLTRQMAQNSLSDGQRRRAERLGLEQLQQEYETLKSQVSKVIDPESHEPKEVYHGTTVEFNTFDKKYLGSNTHSPSAKMAFFAASNEDLARRVYAELETSKEYIVYNDAITTFKNSIERGKKIGRFLSLQYFLDQSFGKSENKLKLLKANYPDVNIIPLDNSNNQGSKRVSIEEALNWDYKVSEELLYNILTILENETNEGKLNEQQLSSISRGILQIRSLTSQRTQELANRIGKKDSQNGLHTSQRAGAERLGLEQLQQEYETLKASISGAIDTETLEPIPVYHSNESNNINEFTEGTIVTPLTITPKNSKPIPNTITIGYTPKGKTKQTYTVKEEGNSWHIYNKEGKEVFKQDSKDRKRIPHRAPSITIRIKTNLQ